jgi:hypothetical protein
MHDSIVRKDTGSLYAAKTQSTAILDQNKVDLLKDSKIGSFVALSNSLRELGGEQYAQTWTASQVFGKNGIAEGLRDFSQNWGMEFRTQGNERSGKGTSTYNDLVDEMRRKGVTDPIQQKNLMQQRVKDVEEIGNPNTPDSVKSNLIKSAFSVGNNGFLSKLNMDSFDERGRPVNGMNAVFQKWTAPEVTSEVLRLSKNDPSLWQQYTAWVKQTWATELVPRELADLSKYQKDPDIKISWSSENKRFEVERNRPQFKPGQDGRAPADVMASEQQFQTVQRSINRLNNGMYNMKAIAEKENPGDKTAADAFLLRAIVDATSPEIIRNLNSLPGDLVTKILLGNQRANSKR